MQQTRALFIVRSSVLTLGAVNPTAVSIWLFFYWKKSIFSFFENSSFRQVPSTKLSSNKKQKKNNIYSIPFFHFVQI